ncbi:RNA-directed DNA polymerase, eukaryota [Tanacetum coccineum]
MVNSLECAFATSLREKISSIDIKAEIGPLTLDEVMTRAMSVKELANLEYSKAKDLRKKSKSKWALEGDENSGFFHGIINNNMNRSIKGLNIQGSWQIYSSDSSYLEPCSDDEMKDAVWNCGSAKSPGPDGFTFMIFKKYWDVIGGEILLSVKEFETMSSIPRGCNSSFFNLVPKVEDPIVIGDFRPISLIGCQYKIIAKVLATCLANVISFVIVGEVQMAFIKGRQIIDVPIMRKWIHSCLDSAFALVLINGSPTLKFKLHCGLRQGDPLSPLLFILAIETLNVAFIEAKNKNLFHGVEVGVDKAHVSHLQFVDDALLLGDWSKPNNENLSIILKCFHLTSGFKVNFSKSSSLALAPKTIINKLEGIRRKFFWGGSSDTYKIPWIAWNKVISSPKQGGLDIGSLHAEIMAISNMLANLVLSPSCDIWECVIDDTRSFSSQRIAKGRLLTKINLDLSGIDFHLVNCPLCDDDLETKHHLFIPYGIAKEVWLDVLRWWNLPDANFSTINGLFSLADHTYLTPNQRVLLLNDGIVAYLKALWMQSQWVVTMFVTWLVDVTWCRGTKQSDTYQESCSLKIKHKDDPKLSAISPLLTMKTDIATDLA